MARKIRQNNLENRTNRLKLPVAKKPIFVRIGQGVSLGYRRNQTAGTWVIRVANGSGGGPVTRFAFADDYDEANGVDILNYWEAQDKAKSIARTNQGLTATGPVTVRVATETYLKVLAGKNANTASDTRGRLEKHFLSKYGEKLVTNITKTMLENWLTSLVAQSDDQERIRKSKDTANRVLTMVKAVLNHALKDPSNGLVDDKAWKLVKPFQNVSKPRDIRYTNDEVKKILSVCPDIATQNLIKAGFLTGARYGELIKAKISDFDKVGKSLIVNGKTGIRTIILQDNAFDLFNKIVSDRDDNEFIFIKKDKNRWKASEQTRPFKEALYRAGLSDKGCFYALRHTYISHAIEGGIPLILIAKNCGTSVRIIEKTYAKILAEKEREFIEKGAPSLE